MATAIDEKMVITDSIVDELMEDWLDRDGETFVKKRTTGRIGWEDELEKDEAYSAFFLEAPTLKELIKRAYPLAKDMIIAMDLPVKVKLRITKGGDSATDGKNMFVSTEVFDDPELTNGEKLDVFMGLTVHECCHILYTRMEDSRKIDMLVIHKIYNILEDERIERLCGEEKPGFTNFLEKTKAYYFDKFWLDAIYGKDLTKEPPFLRFMNLLLEIIRYPKYLDENEIIAFARYLVKVKELVLPYPETTKEVVDVSYKIFEIVREMYSDIEKEEERKRREREEGESDDSGESDGMKIGIATDSVGGEKSDGGSGTDDVDAVIDMRSGDSTEGDVDEGDEDEKGAGKKEEKTETKGRTEKEIEKDAEEKMRSDIEKVLPMLKDVAKDSTEGDVAAEVKADHGTLGEVCEGTIETGDTRDTFFKRAEEDAVEYKKSLSRVKKYVPAIAKALRGNCRDYKLIHRSMRSGVLDTSKLVEAIQGVPTVYIREGAVKTDKIAVCVVIDESGSMMGTRIQSARDTAVLINEALKGIPNIELFIYGHSGDIRYSGATEMWIYREKGFAPPFALGTASARCENRDGTAIYEVARRVRKQTQEPLVMFVLSDGAPAADRYWGESAFQHVRENVAKVEKMNITVIQVCINHSYDPSKMFKHFLVLEDMGSLAKNLSREVQKAALQKGKNHVV